MCSAIRFSKTAAKLNKIFLHLKKILPAKVKDQFCPNIKSEIYNNKVNGILI